MMNDTQFDAAIDEAKNAIQHGKTRGQFLRDSDRTYKDCTNRDLTQDQLQEYSHAYTAAAAAIELAKKCDPSNWG